jgi:hypothetical protein
MKDGFERRALLLHLGEVMETVASVLKHGERGTVQQVSAADASLAGLPLIEQVSPRMNVLEFAQRASAAFCTWPSELLEAELNREELASTVQRSLFAGNPAGWRAYIAGLKPEVPWFGDGVPVQQSAAEAAAGQTPGEPEVEAPEPEAPDAGDVERAEDSGAGSRESIESSEGYYPAWPWRRAT